MATSAIKNWIKNCRLCYLQRICSKFPLGCHPSSIVVATHHPCPTIYLSPDYGFSAGIVHFLDFHPGSRSTYPNIILVISNTKSWPGTIMPIFPTGLSTKFCRPGVLRGRLPIVCARLTFPLPVLNIEPNPID